MPYGKHDEVREDALKCY